jgi:Cupin
MRKTVAGYDDRGVAQQLARDLRIESSVLCRSVMGPPWGFGIPGRETGTFHMVLEGRGWLDVEALDGPIEMGPGDLAVLPTGSPHWMRDAPGSTAPPLTAILASHDVVDGELRFGTDDGPLTEVVCGLFAFEEGHHASWIDGLPPVVTSARGWDGGGWRSPVIEALSHEARRPTPGGSLIVNRLLETLIADALRAELAAALADGGAPTAALADARIGRALLPHARSAV